MSTRLDVRKAAILGAGVMGAQIAALFAASGVKTMLFDLPSDKGDPSQLANGAIKALQKLKPAPLTTHRNIEFISGANYEEHLHELKDCDFILEAISERQDWKEALYEKILGYINERAVVATNTSGLEIEVLAKSLPEKLRSRFCGVHFFNPPRYMKLVELIPHSTTDTNLVDALESFMVVRLGKGVVRAKDKPNFIGNRIGVFSMLCTLHHAEKFELPPDIVDALTGPVIGRPKSATFRTLDVVGLDTMKHVVNTLHKSLPEDPWHGYYALPLWIETLIEKGAVGQKVKQGVYKKEGKAILVFDKSQGDYRTSNIKADHSVLEILKHPNPKERFAALKASEHPQAQFLWCLYRDLFHYCAFHLNDIAENVSDVDKAMRWGYGWARGPFETWQMGDLSALKSLIDEDLAADKGMVKQGLPDWLNALKAGFYQGDKGYAPDSKAYQSPSELACYQRQLFKEPIGEGQNEYGTTLFETDAVRMWHMGDRQAILSFKSKKNSVTDEVLDGILEAVDRAEKDFDALILWQTQGDDFSVGANLKMLIDSMAKGRVDDLEKAVAKFQETAMRLRSASIPTVAALRGLTLGGGCELALHTDKIVGHIETYMGLVEVGVGLLPAGGGTKEMAMRAADQSLNPLMLQTNLEKYFKQIAMGEMAMSAHEAQDKHYFAPSDVVVMNKDELLFMAKQTAQALSGPQYVPPASRKFMVLGKQGIANFQTQLINMLEGQFISPHDYLIGSHVAHVICGGEVEKGTMVTERWMLELERQAFVELAKTELTQARIKHTLETGKPLRN